MRSLGADARLRGGKGKRDFWDFCGQKNDATAGLMLID